MHKPTEKQMDSLYHAKYGGKGGNTPQDLDRLIVQECRRLMKPINTFLLSYYKVKVITYKGLNADHQVFLSASAYGPDVVQYANYTIKTQ